MTILRINSQCNSLYYILLLSQISILSAGQTIAQTIISTDGSTPTTTPSSCSTSCDIYGGEVRGINLFHSFSDFDIANGSSVLFVDPGVKNIISRVTGNRQSRILGTLGVSQGNANLFFVNPKGVFFGPNSQLNLNGSFVATTAHKLQFGTQGAISTLSANKIPLLTIDPTAFIYTSRGEQIRVQSNTPITTPEVSLSGIPAFGLKVPNGKNILLVGGNISLEGGGLFAFGGQIGLGGLSEAGFIKIIEKNNKYSLDFQKKLVRSDVTITKKSEINVIGRTGGDISIYGDNISIFDESLLDAGIYRDQGFINNQSGNISLDSSNKTRIRNSTIRNIAQENSIGNSGDITITSHDIIVSDNSRIENSTLGRGDSGNIIFNSKGLVSLGNSSFVLNNVRQDAIGNGGGISISSQNINLEDFSAIQTATFGVGNAGEISIRAANNIHLNSGSRIISSVSRDIPSTPENDTGVGDTGNVKLVANKILVQNFGRIATFVLGLGSAGDVSVTAYEEISLLTDGRIGSTINGRDLAQLNSSNEPKIINALRNPQFLSDINSPGNITLTSPKVTLKSGSQIANFATGNGIATSGDIVVNASNSVSIDGFLTGSEFLENEYPFPNGESGFSSGLFTFSRESITGLAGNIIVKTQDFYLTNGGAVSSQTFNSSSGGDITISAINFTATNGGQIRTTASGAGNAGDITLKVNGDIILSGSDSNFEKRLTNLPLGLLVFEGVQPEQATREANLLRLIGPQSGLFANTTPGATGRGGNIIIDPRLVLIKNGAGIAVDSQGSGLGGNINLISDKLQLSNQAFITATSLNSQGGNITLTLDDFLFMRGQSRISASAGSPGKPGDGGNINIVADYIVAEPNTNSDITADSFVGKGGNITITPRRGFLGFVIRKQEDLKENNPEDLTSNDISANSRSGQPSLNGQVSINDPDVDPSDNLSEQPEVVEPPQEIAKGCRPGQSLGGSTFTNVGRGGLPLSPQQTQTPTNVWQDLRSHNLQPTSISSTDPSPTSLIPTPPPSITEAKGWTKDTQGRIYLTANVPQPTQTPQPIATC